MPDASAPLTDLGECIQHWLRRYPELPLPGGGHTLERWRTLAGIAADDVCAAKVLEAHYDAAAILAELAPRLEIDPSTLRAVWAAEPPNAKVLFSLLSGGHGAVSGEKGWCSGADLVSEALITGHLGDERVLALVPLGRLGVSAVDDSWRAVGMSRVNSGRVRFDGAQATLIGQPGAYLTRPGFWHGGAGIAACWYGAATAIAEPLRVHARAESDSTTQQHLGVVDMVLHGSREVLRALAGQIDAQPDLPHTTEVIRARSIVERACTLVIDRVGRALGPGPMCEDARHAARCADLTVFIRQSHADRDWQALGKSAHGNAEGWPL